MNKLILHSVKGSIGSAHAPDKKYWHIWSTRVAQLLTVALVLCQLPVDAATHSYDALNRLTSVVYSPSQRIDYVYDAAGNLIEERINGAAGLTVTAQPNPIAGGTVAISPAQSSFVAGDVVTVTATPTAGYNFTGWSGVSGCTAATACTFTVGSSNIAAVANFAAASNLQPLRVIVIPPDGGTVTQPNPAGYAPGAAISLTASPASALGYTLIDWYGAGCTNFGGVTCNFSMPNAASDVFVKFRQVGTGQELVVSPSGMAGLSYSVLAAGAVEVTPAQRYLPAGTTVTLKFRPATGYRFYALRVERADTGWGPDTSLCSSVQSGFWFPGEEPSCSFVMPSTDIMVIPTFIPDPTRYLIDATVAPINGGAVSFGFVSTIPDPVLTNWYPVSGPIENRRTAAAGTAVTLTAQPANARQFVNWQNGPCANSTNPVCSFTMPANPVVSNPLFSATPDPSCTYAVTAPSLAFPGAGATRTVTVSTQAGCNFNALAFEQGGSSVGTVSVAGGVVTFTLPAYTANAGRVGYIQIDTGREMFTLPFIQSGNSSTSQSTLAATDFGTAGAGDVPTTTKTVSFSNTTASALLLRGIVTVGPYAIRSHNCVNTLAISASCSAVLEFVPRRAVNAAGELLLVANNHTFSAPLTGTVLPTRENVAAATAGGAIATTTLQSTTAFPDWALIDGGRRNPPVWASGEPVNPQYLEVRFASARTVDRLYLFGNYTSDGFSTISFAEPSTLSTEISPQVAGFSVQYWTGTSWAAVSEVSRVDGANVWRRVTFAPVATDRVRVALPTVTGARQMVANELEVWTTAADTTPDAFSFASALGVAVSTPIQSAAITPIGFSASTPISVTGGSYSIGCNGVFTSAAGTLLPGQSVCVRHTSASVGSTTVTTSLTIGGVTGTFSSTTQNVVVVPSDVTPDPIASQSIVDVALGSTVYFAPFSVTGINAPATLTVGGAGGLEVSVGCTGSFSASPGSVTNGESVCVRHIAASAALTNVVSSLAVGTATVTFTSRTAAPAPTCSLDVDGANGTTAAVDAVIIDRYLLGIRGDALVAGLPLPLGPRNTGALLQAFIGTGTQFDVVGRPVAAPTALIDGLILTRLMRLFPDSALLTGITVPAGSQFTSAAQIRANVNAKCGTSF